jgi:two-component sensor histidine kinase
VTLAATSAQSLGLALHELATNAVKYGALSQAAGGLDVVWRIENEGKERWVVLEWKERGISLPGGVRPTRKGYGSQLIERALPYQLGARTELQFRSDGVRCAISVPLKADEGEALHA